MGTTVFPVREPDAEAIDDTFRISVHPHHRRLRHVALDAAIVAQFCQRTASIEVQNLEYVPFMRFMLAETLIECAGHDFADTLRSVIVDRETGGFTTGMSGITDDVDDFVRSVPQWVICWGHATMTPCLARTMPASS